MSVYQSVLLRSTEGDASTAREGECGGPSRFGLICTIDKGNASRLIIVRQQGCHNRNHLVYLCLWSAVLYASRQQCLLSQ